MVMRHTLPRSSQLPYAAGPDQGWQRDRGRETTVAMLITFVSNCQSRNSPLTCRKYASTSTSASGGMTIISSEFSTGDSRHYGFPAPAYSNLFRSPYMKSYHVTRPVSVLGKCRLILLSTPNHEHIQSVGGKQLNLSISLIVCAHVILSREEHRACPMSAVTKHWYPLFQTIAMAVHIRIRHI